VNKIEQLCIFIGLGYIYISMWAYMDLKIEIPLKWIAKL